jgi:hypothetical protein
VPAPAADIAVGDGHVAVAGEFLATVIARPKSSTNSQDALGCQPSGRGLCHNHDLLAGRRSAFPPVGQVEQVPSHDGRPNSLPHRAHLADRVPGDLEWSTVDNFRVTMKYH